MASLQNKTQPLSLKDLFKNIQSGFSTTPVTNAPVPMRTQTLPNGGGSYSTPSGQIPSLNATYRGGAGPMSMVPPATTTKTPVTPPGKSSSPVSGPVTKSSTPSNIPPQWINPNGGLYSPEEVAANLAATVPGATRGANGDIPKYAGDTLTQGPQTVEQLQQSAAGLNNARNDIATGEKDPYKVGSESGVAYTPAELAAIEKAYAGIYDPAINSALSKLDVKQKEDASALESKNKLAEMAQQHKYDLELKRTPSGDSKSTVGAFSATYVPGANPAVDAWAQRIYDGSAKITDIPVSDKGLRNAVTIALTTLGNSLSGGPTTTELGKAVLNNAKDLLAKFDAGNTGAVGKSSVFNFATVPGTDKANFKNEFNSVKSQLALEAVKYLKGQGAVSDAERALLSQAASKLNLAQSEDEFRTTLQDIINKLEGHATDGNVVTAPDGTQVQIID